jgi:hypothetical protein
MASRFFSFRVLLVLLLLAGTAIVVSMSLATYERTSSIDVQPQRKSTQSERSIKLKEIKSLFSSIRKDPQKFAVIKEKNLFSPKREHWQPPQPKKEDKKEEKKEEKPKPPPADRDDVILYGTYTSNATKRAIIHFKKFRFSPSSRVVSVGDVLRDGEKRGDDVYYKIASIEKNNVELVDYRDRKFSVNIYAHDIEAAVKQRSEQNIQISESKQKEGSSVVGQAPQRQEKRSSGSGVQNLSTREKERLHQEGKLRKIETPFGTLYREKKQ